MIKDLLKKLQIPISLFVTIYSSYWLITNPFESYTLPVIIIWLPDVIGWNAFFVVLGIIFGCITFAILNSLTENKSNEEEN